MRMHTPWICGLLALALPASMARAAVLVEYDFNVNADTYPASFTAAGVTTTDITGSNVTLNNVLITYPSRVLYVDPDGNETFNSGVYFGFTVTPDAGVILDLEELAFLAAKGGSTGHRGLEIRSSVDGFADNLVVTPDTSTLGSVRPNLTAYSVDLSAPGFDAITAATPIELRIYPFTDDDGRSIELDDIQMVGEIIPEPATMALALLGVPLALRRRQRP